MVMELDKILLDEIEKFGQTPKILSLNDKTFDDGGYRTAITRAVRDLTARTLTPISKGEGSLVEELLSEQETNSFFNNIKKYFENSELDKDSFDDWHSKRCKEVLTVINKHYTNQDGSEICYGKAQKIVNMTLKGCYCLDGARQKEEYFTYCHMALDSFTLAWYNRNAQANRFEKNKTAWSNLTEEKYKNIQTNIRKIELDIKLFKNLTPLQEEFLIWPLEIMINTVKEVNKCFGGLIDGDFVEEYFETYKMKNDLRMANTILGRIQNDSLDPEFIAFLEKIPKNQTGKIKAAEFILEKYN